MKIKTKHIITCIKCLFLGLVMALPFIAVLPTALYYGFNEHAISGDKIEYEYQTNELETIEDLKVGNVYDIYYDESGENIIYQMLNDTDYTNTIKYIKLAIGNIVDIQTLQQDIVESSEWLTPDKENYIQFDIIERNLIYFTISLENLMLNNKGYIVREYEYTNNRTDRYIEATIILDEYLQNYLHDQVDIYLVEEAIKNGTIKKATYQGNAKIIEEITNQNALEIAFNNVFTTKGFNWVSNSIIATPIYAFVGAFGLTNDLFISNLIVYWTNILLIYAILNIVLVVFTKLTQLGKKKEED